MIFPWDKQSAWLSSNEVQYFSRVCEYHVHLLPQKGENFKNSDLTEIVSKQILISKITQLPSPLTTGSQYLGKLSAACK